MSARHHLYEDAAHFGSVVTPADRAAVAEFLTHIGAVNWAERLRQVREIQSGEHDGHVLTRAFSEHRATAERAARIEGARLGLRVAARVVRLFGLPDSPALCYGLNAGDLEAAILALSPEELVGEENEFEIPPGEIAGRAQGRRSTRYA